jgi:hypothetical protein
MNFLLQVISASLLSIKPAPTTESSLVFWLEFILSMVLAREDVSVGQCGLQLSP